MRACHRERSACNQTAYWSEPMNADYYSADQHYRTSMQGQYRYPPQVPSSQMTSYNQIRPSTYQQIPYSNQIWANEIARSPDNSTYDAQSAKQSGKFLCLYEPCASNLVGFSRKADLERHVSVMHNRAQLVLTDCEVPGCRRKGSQGFSRKDKMIDHMREVHKVPIPKRLSNKNSPTMVE